MSASASIWVKEGMYWNSICTTSGTPFSALSAVRSLVYSSAPCPALTYFTVTFLWVSLYSSTSSFIPGTQDQKVMVAGPCDEPQPVARTTSSTTAASGPVKRTGPTNLRTFIRATPFPGRNDLRTPNGHLSRVHPGSTFPYPTPVGRRHQRTRTRPQNYHTNPIPGATLQSNRATRYVACKKSLRLWLTLAGDLCSRGPYSFWHSIAMRLYELVDQRCYLVQGEDARSVAVEHSGVMDVVPPTLQRRPDREVLDDRVWDAGPSTLRREVSYMAGPQARAVDQYRHFHAASFRKVRNETRILHVAVDGPRLTGDERVHDERTVLDAPAQREVLSGEQFATGLGVLEEVLLAAPDVLVNRYVVEFDQLIVPEEVGCVLGVVLARFGDEVPEAAHQLEAHLVFGVHVRVLHRREEPRVGILAFHFEARHPGDVVDAGALVEKVLMLDADVGGYLARGVRDAVAEPDALNLGAGCVECLHQDAHRVRVVKEHRFRTEFAHLAGEVEHEGDGTQSAEDAAYTHRVGDRLLETVLFGDLEVQEGSLVHPDLDHVHDEVSPFERPPSVEMFLDIGTSAELIRGPAGHHGCGFETLGIYVVQGDGGSVQLGEAQGVCQEVLGKDDTPCADKGYLQD